MFDSAEKMTRRINGEVSNVRIGLMIKRHDRRCKEFGPVAEKSRR